MSSVLRRAAAATGALVCLLTPAAAPAQAQAPRQPDPGGLFLTVSGSQNTWIRGVVLDCPEGTGHHPQGRQACAELAQAEGNPDALSGDPHPCTEEYDPVTATAIGSWQDRVIVFTRKYANACELDARTGAVFRF